MIRDLRDPNDGGEARGARREDGFARLREIEHAVLQIEDEVIEAEPGKKQCEVATCREEGERALAMFTLPEPRFKGISVFHASVFRRFHSSRAARSSAGSLI